MKDGTSKNEIRFWGFDLCRVWRKENKMPLIRLRTDCLRVDQKTLWTLRIQAWKFDLVSQCQVLRHAWHWCDKHPVVLSSPLKRLKHGVHSASQCCSLFLLIYKGSSIRRDAQVHQHLAPGPALFFFFFGWSWRGKKQAKRIHRRSSIYPPIHLSIHPGSSGAAYGSTWYVEYSPKCRRMARRRAESPADDF